MPLKKCKVRMLRSVRTGQTETHVVCRKKTNTLKQSCTAHTLSKKI